ncbi:hepatoma-derived growth factor-related protein 2-like isoform X2 [Anopheles moucheti]|uniref:hepatoma-derived growth factor-related protein 2-like isoform X2 n=1 Tax=Anopheles moucheti TaxID=186751 RepID=UPI0022F0C17E|nr:hepatoma-derived growth factor-related protein 2-like isoform X2 [Anopheles moucheti]
MVASKKSFEVGDLVFAKVKGYPFWPAKITLIGKSKDSVYFYGTGEIGNVKKGDMYPYESSKEKFSTEKFMKRKGFKEALMQIESALSGDDPSPLAFDVAAVQSGMDDTLESQQTSISAAETTFNESHVSANSTAYNVSKVKLETSENDNTNTPQTASSHAKSNSNTKASATKKANSALAMVPNNGAQKKVFDSPVPLQDAVGATDTKEIVSQRGRIIKQKRFKDGDEEESTGGSPPKKKAAKTTTKAAPLSTTPGTKKNLDAFDKLADERLFVLKLERQLVELNLEVKSSVKLNGADPERCVKLMEQYENLSVTPTILKKNPNCVETMKRLRKYVGNAKAWNLDDKQKLKFDFQAQLIRQKAEQIYARFKDILGMPDSEMPFWDWFVQQVNTFGQRTQHLTQEELYLLSDEKELEDCNIQNSNNTTNATHGTQETKTNSLTAEENEGADEGFDPEVTAPEESTTNVGE